MTSQGSPWPRLRRALDHGNLVEARSAASELEHVGLAEALELVLLIRDRDPGKYDRAALRWHARLCAYVKTMPLGEAVVILALREQLPGERASAAAQALADFLYRHGLERSCEVLVRWAQI